MNASELREAKKALDNSQVISFPTETVMGFGAYYDDYEAYSLLNTIKGRPENKPYTLMVADIMDIDNFAILSLRDRMIVNKFMPGPITVLVRAKDNLPGYVTHNSGIIGIRISDMEDIRSLIRFVGKPLLVPSANRSGEPPILTAADVKKEFGDQIPFIYNKNALGKLPSTIIDLTGENVKIVREGPIALDAIERSLKTMKIALGCDHGGLEYKDAIKEHLLLNGYEVEDCGTFSKESCHYPQFALKVAKKVSDEECRFGVLVCTSGEGVAIAANKVSNVRCGIGYNDEVSALMRQHNDANVIAFGQKFMALEDVIRRVDIFISSQFEGGRHADRVKMINEIK